MTDAPALNYPNWCIPGPTIEQPAAQKWKVLPITLQTLVLRSPTGVLIEAEGRVGLA